MNDVQAIFDRYASDPEVTRYLGWARHLSLAESRAFVKFSNDQWSRWKAGPMLAISREQGMLLGTSGLMLETAAQASTGYVFARDSWGKGYATETLHAMVDLAARLGVERLTAECHPDPFASRHVLEKCGLQREPLKPQSLLPNLSPEFHDCLVYSLAPPAR